ncbi:transcriptional regulator, TetR family [Desulfotomaculum arcticum]|uniref:Transcriptional regulator, TetR family n=1 Tax=Desulfotruncus arcticus DSM 17038 TaxID=1121424 RepID=A0A1I2PJC6_9FIRM|nr:transcriptional regulator, TetR family [Desulfotomaculum arcticum] [Desulfotruncus arcticus DSM 17038]
MLLLKDIESKAEETKQRILQSAEKIFAQKGLDGARVDEIAELAKINKRMLYYYFGSKENLYQAVLNRNFNKIYTTGMLAVQEGSGPREKAEQVIRSYFYFLAENPEYVRIMGWEAMQGGKYARELLPDYLWESWPVLNEIMKSGVQEGLFRPHIDIRQVLVSVNSLCLFYFTRRYMLQFMWEEDIISPAMLEKRLQHILELIFEGISC